MPDIVLVINHTAISQISMLGDSEIEQIHIQCNDDTPTGSGTVRPSSVCVCVSSETRTEGNAGSGDTESSFVYVLQVDSVIQSGDSQSPVSATLGAASTESRNAFDDSLEVTSNSNNNNTVHTAQSNNVGAVFLW